MDTIVITDLEVRYCVGVTDEERRSAQRLLLTIEIRHDFAPAIKTDSVAHTVDYFAVSQALLTFGEGKEWKLIEKLAADLADKDGSESGTGAASSALVRACVRFVSVSDPLNPRASAARRLSSCIYIVRRIELNCAAHLQFASSARTDNEKKTTLFDRLDGDLRLRNRPSSVHDRDFGED